MARWHWYRYVGDIGQRDISLAGDRDYERSARTGEVSQFHGVFREARQRQGDENFTLTATAQAPRNFLRSAIACDTHHCIKERQQSVLRIFCEIAGRTKPQQ